MKSKVFEWLFFLVAIAEIGSQLINRPEWNLFIKPLIVLSLLAFYFLKVDSKNHLFIGSLTFCWLGDVLLLFNHRNEIFFLAGLGSFLVAHVSLIVLYGKLKTKKGEGMNGPQKARASFPIILAGTGLVTILYPALGDLKIPVMAYTFALLLMILRAIYRYGFTSLQSFWSVTVGALLFMISDSLLAINKFLQPVDSAELLIMTTYMGAVYMITKGVIAHDQTKTSE